MTKTTMRQRQLLTGQTLQLIQGDITQLEVDGIVNAANAHLRHGGGLAAVIARRGGKAIDQESRAWVQQHGPVTHDEPAFTSAGNLPHKYVIHAVGPVWRGGQDDEDRKLAAAVSGSLHRADQLGLSSLAFPAISTGIFRFPPKRAARVMLQAIIRYFEQHASSKLALISLVLYDAPTLEAFLQVWDAEGPPR